MERLRLKFDISSYLSSGLVVVEIHQGLIFFRLLSALPSISCIHEVAREGDAKVDVVAAA